MFSTLSTIETNEETIRVHVYDDSGYLPIHRAAFNGNETIIKNILDDAIKRNELTQQLEAITHDEHEFTPLLLATAVGRLEIIACLIKYPVNLNASDAKGYDMAAIAAMSQNERTFRYIVDLSISPEKYNVWKSLFKLFSSPNDNESIICGRMLEMLTRSELDKSSLNSYWLSMIDNDLLPILIKIFYLSKTDDVLLSAFLILYNVLNEVPNVKHEFKTIENAFSSLLKHTNSSNKQILTLLGRVLSCLSKDKSLIDSMVEQNIIETLINLIDNERSPQIISPYFDCLSNIVSYSHVYQEKIGQSMNFLSLIAQVYLEEYDLNLSLSVVRFIRQLVKHNQRIQNTFVEYGVCQHLLGALSATSKELQQVSIETIQTLCYKNKHVQQIFLNENAVEQLINLLDKTNMSSLQIAIVCTLWTLCENSSTRKREVATKIGIKKLITFYTMKSDEHLLAVTEAVNELAKSPPSMQLNVQEEINHAQGILYFVRLLKSDNESLVLSILKTLQYITCTAGFVANHVNQEVILKQDGIPFIVALMMHARSELIQVEAAQTLACIALSNSQCSNIIENTLDFSYSHIIKLMKSNNLDVQLKATNTLATFAYNNSRVQSHFARQFQLSFNYFQNFFENDDETIRCISAFQIIVLSNLIQHQRTSITVAIGCGILVDILRLSKCDEAKSIAADCLARLVHMKSVSEINKHTGVPQSLMSVNAIDYLCNLFTSSNDITIGNASIALGFLSHFPEGRRKILNRCRSEPDIMAFLKVYNCVPGSPSRLSKQILEEWQRFFTLKLPQLNLRNTNVRYFKVLANHVERSRAPPSANFKEENQTSSNIMKFFLPPLHQKV